MNMRNVQQGNRTIRQIVIETVRAPYFDRTMPEELVLHFHPSWDALSELALLLVVLTDIEAISLYPGMSIADLIAVAEAAPLIEA